MPTYEKIPADPFGGIEMIKQTDADGSISWIPTDPANSDYQAYLASQENN